MSFKLEQLQIVDELVMVIFQISIKLLRFLSRCCQEYLEEIIDSRSITGATIIYENSIFYIAESIEMS